MSSKTKIVVLHLKELIYTGIFVILGILFIILLFIMFRSDKDTPADTVPPESEEEPLPPAYKPGVYKSAVYLDGETVEIDLAVDESQIVSLTMQPLSDKISTLYPLLEPSFQSLSEQICENQSLEDVTYAEEATYTSQLLLEAIENTLAKTYAEQ